MCASMEVNTVTSIHIEQSEFSSAYILDMRECRNLIFLFKRQLLDSCCSSINETICVWPYRSDLSEAANNARTRCFCWEPTIKWSRRHRTDKSRRIAARCWFDVNKSRGNSMRVNSVHNVLCLSSRRLQLHMDSTCCFIYSNIIRCNWWVCATGDVCDSNSVATDIVALQFSKPTKQMPNLHSG